MGDRTENLCIDMYPVGGLTVIITLLLPATQVLTEHWFVRPLTTFETTERENGRENGRERGRERENSPEGVATVTNNRPYVSVGAEESTGATGGRAPAEVRVVLDKAAGDEQLVLLVDLGWGA